jgi:geranylgeranyl diphosphate synthase type I
MQKTEMKETASVTDTLKRFKKEIDPLLGAYFDEAIAEARKENVFVADALRQVKKIVLGGGKRLRSALMCYGYLAAGGRDRQMILETSMSVEVVHTFLLIHDDIIDRDDFRHGQRTIHSHYTALGKKFLTAHEATHFGDAIGIVVGDMIAAFGNDIIFRSPFPDGKKFRALSVLQKIVAYTVIGQTMDIYGEYRKKVSEKDILKMYEYKTAKYTVEGPLALGALLAGASDEFIATLSGYAIPVGIAFQIRDDILGMFGNESKLGKPVGSDLAEGKRTLLVSFAEKASDAVGKKRIEALLSKGDAVTERDVKAFRSILEETGALERARTVMERYVEEGKRALDGATDMHPDAKAFLIAVADYIVKRDV